MSASINTLPDPILGEIFKFLTNDKMTTSRISMVCKKWHAMPAIELVVSIFRENRAAQIQEGFPKFIVDIFDSRRISIWRLPRLEVEMINSKETLSDAKCILKPEQMVDRTGKVQPMMRYYEPNIGYVVLLFLVEKCYFEIINGSAVSNAKKGVIHFIFCKRDCYVKLFWTFPDEKNNLLMGMLNAEGDIVQITAPTKPHPLQRWISDILAQKPSQKDNSSLFQLVSDIPQTKEPCPTVPESCLPPAPQPSFQSLLDLRFTRFVRWLFPTQQSQHSSSV